MWEVRYLPEAVGERGKLPAGELVALDRAVEKLENLGPNLPYPHSSAVREATALRELRPRAGKSPWRAFYRRVGEIFVIAAVGPEAQQDKRGFKRACRDAEDRLVQGDDDDGEGVRAKDRS